MLSRYREREYFTFLVGITWEDAPIVQYASLDQDYKVRCVVRANPPANIDWLKESLIISTGNYQSQLIPFIFLLSEMYARL